MPNWMWKKVQQTLQASIYIPPPANGHCSNTGTTFEKGASLIRPNRCLSRVFWYLSSIESALIWPIYETVSALSTPLSAKDVCVGIPRGLSHPKTTRVHGSPSVWTKKEEEPWKTCCRLHSGRLCDETPMIPKPATSALSRHGPHLGWATRLALSDNPDNIIFAQNWASLGLHNSSFSSCFPLLYNLTIWVMAKNVLNFQVLLWSSRRHTIQNH